MLRIWIGLLIIGAVPLALMGMAFDAGPSTAAYIIVTVAWFYPPAVAVAWFCRRRMPVLIWLPAFTPLFFTTAIIVGLFSKS